MSNDKAMSLSVPAVLMDRIRAGLVSSLFNNAIYLILNSGSIAILGFLFWYVMARRFSPAEVGLGSALTAAAGLVAAIAHFGFGTGMIRFVPELRDEQNDLVNSVLWFAFLSSCGLASVYLLGIGRWSPKLVFLHTNGLLEVGFVLSAALATVSALVDSSFVAQRQAKGALWKNIAIGASKIPLPLVLFFPLGGYGIFISSGLATAVGLCLAFMVLVPRAYPAFRIRWVIRCRLIRYMLPFSLSNYVSGLFVNAIGYIFPILVLNVCGSADSAYFYIAWMITSVINIIPTGIGLSVFAECSHYPQRTREYLTRGIRLCGALLLAADGSIYCLGGLILGLFGSPYALNGLGLLRILIMSNFPLAVATFFLVVNQLRKRLDLVVIQSISSSALAIGLSYWCMKKMGLDGIGVGYSLAMLVIAAVVALPLWRAARGVQEPRGRSAENR